MTTTARHLRSVPTITPTQGTPMTQHVLYDGGKAMKIVVETTSDSGGRYANLRSDSIWMTLEQAREVFTRGLALIEAADQVPSSSAVTGSDREASLEPDPATEVVRVEDSVGRIAAFGNRRDGWTITGYDKTFVICRNSRGVLHDSTVRVMR